MRLDRKSRRNQSWFVTPTNLNLLTEPINKVIKPNQIYSDYTIPVKAISPEKLWNNALILEKPPVYYSVDIGKPQCSCDCHKRKNDCSESFLSTANSKRSNVLTPSPIKNSAREVLSRHSLNRSPIFPYGSSDVVKEKTLKNKKLFQLKPRGVIS